MIASDVFKPESHLSLNWGSYTLALITLLILIFILIKKQNPLLTRKSDCTLIEKKVLSHKTVVYIIEYQSQRFILADNQQSLAIQPLPQFTQENCDA